MKINKKITFSIILSIVIILLAVTILISRQKEYSYNNQIITGSSLIQTESDSIDTDGDGLKDWEEDVRGTDKKNIDTDNDGTSDYDETQINRDPLKKGPNDKIALEPKATSTQNQEYQKLTDTEKFSRNFFAKFIQLKQANLSGDKESQQDLINELLYSIEVNSVSVPVEMYKTSSIKTVPDSDLSFQIYGNLLAQIYIKYQNEYIKNPFPNVMNSENDVISFSSAAKNAIGIYSRMEKDVLSITVPESLAYSHVDFLNNLYENRQSMIKLSVLDKDPLMALTAMKNQGSITEKQNTILNEIAKKIFSKNISFKTTDAGFFWYKNI